MGGWADVTTDMFSLKYDMYIWDEQLKLLSRLTNVEGLHWLSLVPSILLLLAVVEAPGLVFTGDDRRVELGSSKVGIVAHRGVEAAPTKTLVAGLDLGLYPCCLYCRHSEEILGCSWDVGLAANVPAIWVGLPWYRTYD
ncbi:hypothetical protein FIBSPDRAFT_933186 [Athelia psychrophila]|uniref:Uncharacterized protein n=1 Tax=Athelia psychrophila TaxID=1759441 RepID=A0A166HE40_9AGAM|nr:hypothetical protein FIBSPDRAFT_933186 [Fibularhizoctonia sp. CBS 109695]